MLTTRYRFDHDTFELRQFEAEARASFDRFQFTALYGNYDAQPQLGFLTRRDGILGTATLKLTQNWIATAQVRYDLNVNSLVGTAFGLGYIDECLIVALNYMTNYSYSGNVSADQRVMLQVTLRTLGGGAYNQSLTTQPTGSAF
jgi:LPS-assembly protein